MFAVLTRLWYKVISITCSALFACFCFGLFSSLHEIGFPCVFLSALYTFYMFLVQNVLNINWKHVEFDEGKSQFLLFFSCVSHHTPGTYGYQNLQLD